MKKLLFHSSADGDTYMLTVEGPSEHEMWEDALDWLIGEGFIDPHKTNFSFSTDRIAGTYLHIDGNNEGYYFIDERVKRNKNH